MEALKYSHRENIEDINVARRLTEEAISMCPENPIGYALLALICNLEIPLGATKSPRETVEKAIELAQKALAMDDSLPLPHMTLCTSYSFRREYEKAIAEGERAVSLDPSASTTIAAHAAALLWACRPEEAIPLFQKAIRLNPNADPITFLNFGHALRMTGRFEEAVLAFKKALQRAPNNLIAHIGLGATYSLMDREKEARSEAEEILRINPKFSLDFWAKISPFKDRTEIDKIVNALRKAGLK
jgi:adenylate cyclase